MTICNVCKFGVTEVRIMKMDRHNEKAINDKDVLRCGCGDKIIRVF